MRHEVGKPGSDEDGKQYTTHQAHRHPRPTTLLYELHSKSHLSDPQRLSRLMIASCLAYIWLVYLGVCALQEEWRRLLHRRTRCDLSLFRLGVKLLARALEAHIPIPAGFLVPATLPEPLIWSVQKRAA